MKEPKKKSKIFKKIIIIIISIIILVFAIFGIIKLKNYLELRNSILNQEFLLGTNEYKTIDNIIYYYDSELTEAEEDALFNIANVIMERYPSRNILLTEIKKLKNNKMEYSFTQFVNGQIIDGNNIYITVDKDNKVEDIKIYIDTWSEGNDINSLKINSEKAISIAKNYFLENLEEYKEGTHAFVRSVGDYYMTFKDMIEYYQYEGKPAWKISFPSDYIIIDANTGEIIKKEIHYHGPIT